MGVTPTLGRKYLETYYPESFDTESFFWAVHEIESICGNKKAILDVVTVGKHLNLPPEVIENAALLQFLGGISCELLRSFPDGRATLLDVGGGPTIYQHIPLCLSVGTIVHAEYSRQNLLEVDKFLTGAPDAYDWSRYFETMRKLFREHRSYQALLEALSSDSNTDTARHSREIDDILSAGSITPYVDRLRRVLNGNLMYCDVFDPTLNLRTVSGNIALQARFSGDWTADVVTSFFAVESATDEMVNWERGMDHLIRAVRPGGFFIMTAILNAKWYASGGERVSALPLQESQLEEFLVGRGLTVIEKRVLGGSDHEAVGYDGMVFVFAKR